MTDQRRLAKLDPADLTASQRVLYDTIAGGQRAAGPQLFALTDDAGRLEGPFDAMLRSPALGTSLQALGSAVRFESGLTERCREIAILTVAHAWHSEFEIRAHESVAQSVGLTAADLAHLQHSTMESLEDPFERLVAGTAAAMAGGADLTDDQYRVAHEVLGEQLLFELVTLVGYYAALALQLRVFRVE